MTAARMAKGATLAFAALLWLACAWLLWRTSVPSLHLSGLSESRYFGGRTLARARSFSRGEDALWLLANVAKLVALGVLAWRLPPSIRQIGLGRINTAIVAAMVVLVTVWLVGLPFALADLWWQHHWGLGPFNVVGWLVSQRATLLPEAISVLVGVVLVVGLAGRFRRWWLIAGPVVVAIAFLFAFVGGWLGAAGAGPLKDPVLAADAARFERLEHVSGTPVRVQNVSSVTSQANAFTVGFGPSAHVVIWNTLLDGRFSRGEIDAVLAHELGHVRSRHVLKAIGWTALIVLPVLWLVALATRRRGGVGDPANVPLVFFLLAVLTLLAAPVENAVSRRYEAEADWRSLNATHNPAATAKLFQQFERASLEDPDPGLLDYLWLETHPTLMQRIAMTQAWASARDGRPSQGGPGSP
jgi:Zn-dependent protease with chaperone function